MTCESWRSTAPIPAIFREAFTAAGLPYFNPHALRSTLTHMGEEMYRTPEEFKAWSQNFGHEKVLTTFTSYGAVASHRQGELIRNLANRSPTDTEDIKVLLQKLAKRLDVD